MSATAGQMLEAHWLLCGLRKALPKHAQEPFDDAVAGRPPEWCVGAAPNEFRGHLARLFYLRHRAGQCSLEDYRSVLSAAWLHDHDEVRRASGTRRRLRTMFAAAAFPSPHGLPETVQIWRGASRDSVLWRRGVSWTLDRSTACWFAMRYADIPNACPTVLTAMVPREALLFFSNEREEAEVVCFDTAEAKVDGDPDDWTRTHDAACAERRARQKAWLSGYLPKPEAGA